MLAHCIAALEFLCGCKHSVDSIKQGSPCICTSYNPGIADSLHKLFGGTKPDVARSALACTACLSKGIKQNTYKQLSVYRLLLVLQAGLHEQFGGIKPDVARDAHARAIHDTVSGCLKEAGVEPGQLTAVAVTVGPGLSLCLQVWFLRWAAGRREGA